MVSSATFTHLYNIQLLHPLGFLYVFQFPHHGSSSKNFCRMGSVNLVVIVEAIRDLVVKQSAGFHLSSIILVAVALGMSFLMLFKGAL